MVLSRLLTSGFPCGLIREPRAHVYHAAAAALLDPADGWGPGIAAFSGHKPPLTGLLAQQIASFRGCDKVNGALS